MSEDRFIWHLTAYDIHATYETKVDRITNEEYEFETLHHNSETAFFNTRKSLEGYVCLHAELYNSNIPKSSKRTLEEHYRVVKVDKSKVKNYKRIFPTKPRCRR